ncbi:MAG: hypothetical protein PUB18_01030 [bacterium]|nr:hypothetical protein [bacterium]
MKVNNQIINQLIEHSVFTANQLAIEYHYPDNLTHLLYLMIPAFILKYGMENECYILDSFRSIPIIIEDKQDMVNQAFYQSVPYLQGDHYLTYKMIVLKNYHNIGLMQLLDNLVHEFNHAINSMKQELKVLDHKVYVRTGLTSIIYDSKFFRVVGKEDNSILEEIINTKQTEMIIDIIHSFYQYDIQNREVVTTLFSIHNLISGSYRSNAYLLQSLVCQTLMNNKTFISTLEKLRFQGDIDDIGAWFDQITGKEGSYCQLVSLLQKTFSLQLDLLKQTGIKIFKVRKIKMLNQEAMAIVDLFDRNCNYR